MNTFDTTNRFFKTACYRVYSDFLMPSRLGLYDRLLQTAIDCGYEMHSIVSFWELLRMGSQLPGKKYLILRHDVDTDARTARRMWEAERQYCLRSSFYFRLSTFSPSIMKEIHASGSEASYHYEELATLAKERGLRKAEVYRELPKMRQMFKRNLFRLREKTGLPMQTAASHGDFVNRKLGIANTVVLADEAFRNDVKIILEVNDRAFMGHVTSRHSDRLYPLLWAPNNPMDVFREGKEIVYILTHQRQWYAARSQNMWDDFCRMWQGVRYRLAVSARS